MVESNTTVNNGFPLQFIKYEKMEESSPSSFVLSKKDMKTTKWVVTEKVHGANFSLVTNGSEIKFAKRTDFLSEEEDFFNFQRVVESLREKGLEAFKSIIEKFTDVQMVAVYGELFGGSYPHPDVEQIEDLTAVQPEIFYSPDIHFSAFDIAVVNSSNLRQYLEYETCIEVFKQSKLFYAEPLFIGSYNDACAFNYDFDTTIPKRLGFPSIKGNTAEGIVIKPIKNYDFKGGRVIFKLKADKFKESFLSKMGDKWKGKNDDIEFKKGQYGIKIDFNSINKDMISLINENRLNAVISKEGNLKNSSKLASLVIEDAVEDLTKEKRSYYDNLDQIEKTSLFQDMEKLALSLIDQNTIKRKKKVNK